MSETNLTSCEIVSCRTSSSRKKASLVVFARSVWRSLTLSRGLPATSMHAASPCCTCGCWLWKRGVLGAKPAFTAAAVMMQVEIVADLSNLNTVEGCGDVSNTSGSFFTETLSNQAPSQLKEWTRRRSGIASTENCDRRVITRGKIFFMVQKTLLSNLNPKNGIMTVGIYANRRQSFFWSEFTFVGIISAALKRRLEKHCEAQVGKASTSACNKNLRGARV